MKSNDNSLLGQVLAISASVLPGILSTAMLSLSFAKIAHDFDVSYVVFQWRHVIFFGVFSVSLLFCSSLVQRLGERKSLLAGQVIFIIGALVSGITTNWSLFLVGQFFQAVADGLIVTAQMSLLRQIVPENRLGWAFGWFEGTLALGGLAGPFVGAVLISNFGWRSVFWTLTGCSLATIGWVMAKIPKTEKQIQSSANGSVRSALLLIFLIAGIQLVSSEGITLLKGFLLSSLFLFFVFSEIRAKIGSSLVPWSLLRNVSIALATVRILLVFLVSNALTIHLPSALLAVASLSLPSIGFAFSTAAIARVILQPLLGRIADQHERTMIFIGLCLITFAVAGLGFIPRLDNAAFPGLIICMSLISVGSAMFSPAQLRMANYAAPRNERSRFMGFYMFVQFSTGAFAGPLLARAVFDNRSNKITFQSFETFICLCIILLFFGLLTLRRKSIVGKELEVIS